MEDERQAGDAEAAATPVAVFGGYGGGTIAADAIREIAARKGPYRLAGFLNDTQDVGTMLDGAAVLGSFDGWPQLPEDTAFLAPLHKAKHMPERRKRILELGVPRERWARVIDPLAAVYPDARVESGSVVARFSTLSSAALLGRHAFVRSGTHVGHEAVVGDFVFVGHNVTIGGRVHVGEGAHVGNNAVVREDCAIGAFAVVGIGSVVTKDVAAYTIVAGNPAKVIGEIEVA